MIFALLALLPVDVSVAGPRDCLTAAALERVLDEEAPVDIAEDIAVTVAAGEPDIAGRVRYAVDVDLVLARVEPLHRRVLIRPFECADLPELVALLVHTQRMTPPPRLKRMPPPPPELPHRSREPRVDVTSMLPCEGAPDIDPPSTRLRGAGRSAGTPFVCGDPPALDTVSVSLQAGPWLAVAASGGGFGLRAAADVTVPLGAHLGLVADAQVLGSAVTGGALVAGGGASWSFGRDLAVPGGDARVIAVLDAGGGSGDPASGSSKPGFADSLVVTPKVAMRARAGWVFLEVGALVEVTSARRAPGGYCAFGFRL